MALHVDSAKQRYWLDLIRLWQRSQLSVRAFCQRQRVSEPSFYSWRRTLQERGLLEDKPAADAGVEAPTFLQVTVADGAPGPKSIELVLANGRRLRVRPGFDADMLRQLLRVLEDPAC
jgi:transposase